MGTSVRNSWAPVTALGLALFAMAVARADAAAQEIRARAGSTVTLGARFQAQYEVSSEPEVPSSFYLRRAWVTVDGRLNEFVSGRVQFNAHGSAVLDAYLQLAPSDAFQVQIGQFKRAMSYFWLAANSDLALIERDARVTGVDHCPGVGGVCSFGRFTEALGLDGYEPGLLVTGRVAGGRMGYRVTLTNGEGLGRKDVNGRKSASGRLSMYLGDRGRVSAYLAVDETLDSGGETMGVPAWGAEMEFGGWRDGPHLLATAVRGRNWKLEDDATFSAFQVMGMWYRPLNGQTDLLEAIEPLLRVSWATTGSEDGVSGLVVTPGLMLYAAPRNGISANLDLYRTDERRDWSFKVQAFTFF